MANPDTVRQIALSMPNVTERPAYGTPAFYVKRKLFARLLEDGDSVVVKIEYRDREIRTSADPEVFYITDHYQNYPMMIVRLSRVDDDDLRDLLTNAWEYAAG